MMEGPASNTRRRTSLLISQTPKTKKRTVATPKQLETVFDNNENSNKNDDNEVTLHKENKVLVQKVHYEFGGPLGALVVIVFLPIVIYSLYFLCNEKFCVNAGNVGSVWISIQKNSFSLLSYEGAAIYLGWIVFSVLLEIFLPGETVEGTEILDPNTSKKFKLKYKISGHLQFWLSVFLMGHCFPVLKSVGLESESTYRLLGLMPLPLYRLYDEYVPLITTSVIFASLLSVYLYVSSFFPVGKVLAKGGNTGNVIYDFFIGRELNPRILNNWFDLKEFFELKPGLIGWLILNLGMASKQYQRTGSVSLSMVSIVALQGLYVWDALYQEKAILTTMDITTDGFGFMLAFGDISWVPFIYSLQARYLVDYDPNLNIYQLSAVLALQGLGYFIFRSANSQKDSFRRDPDGEEVKHLKFIQTARGTKLLISGWWGMARKINYTGDWLITLSWCLLCGFQSPIPYFQAIYFVILLIHRAIRDDEICREKYGSDWDEYKKHVPYLFIPFVV